MFAILLSLYMVIIGNYVHSPDSSFTGKYEVILHNTISLLPEYIVCKESILNI